MDSGTDQTPEAPPMPETHAPINAQPPGVASFRTPSLQWFVGVDTRASYKRGMQRPSGTGVANVRGY